MTTSNFSLIPSSELAKRALKIQNDDETYWCLVDEFCSRASEEELKLALAMLKTKNLEERELGIDILGQLGVEEGLFANEAGQALKSCLKDTNKNVRLASIYALGLRGDSKLQKDLLPFADDRDKDIRLALISALPALGTEEALDTLVQLTEDKLVSVRNAAVGALAADWTEDTEELCEIFEDCLEDENSAVRGEALVGLALRESDRAVDLIRRELLGGALNILTLEAAEICASPELSYALNEWRGELTEQEDEELLSGLEKALASCGS